MTRADGGDGREFDLQDALSLPGVAQATSHATAPQPDPALTDPIPTQAGGPRSAGSAAAEFLGDVREVGPLGELLLRTDDAPAFGYFVGFTYLSQGVFATYDPHTGNYGLYNSHKLIFLEPSPTTALSFSTVGIINDAGRLDIGTGAVFVLDPIGLPTMLVYINARSYMQADGDSSVSVLPDEDGVMRLSVTVGAGISPEQIVGSLSRLMSRGLMLIPSLHSQAAARKLESISAGIDHANLYARTFVGGGLPMTLQHDTNTGETSLLHRGNEVTPEYLLHLFFGDKDEPRLEIPTRDADSGDMFSSIADHLELMDGVSPFAQQRRNGAAAGHPALEVAAQIRHAVDSVIPMYFPMLSDEARSAYAYGMASYTDARTVIHALIEILLPQDRRSLLEALENPYIDFGITELQQANHASMAIQLADGSEMLSLPRDHALIRALLRDEWVR
ncbi:MAG: hypothetical protein JJU21_16695 [Salinarimonas sp.]|nr:hypothetical protein [Salinarimonas sp.]